VTALAGTETRRERTRAATIEEIKATALAQMRTNETTDVKFSDIARAMGMTPPALYRYYADRGQLLDDLITDAFDELGAAVAAAQAEVPRDRVGDRWLASAQAYRAWAAREPQQFALILGMPVPGRVCHEEDDSPTTQAARGAMSQLAALFVTAAERGVLGPPMLSEVDPSVCACKEEKHPELVGVVSDETFQAMLHAWATLHGITSLEAYGHLDWLEPEARDALFRGQVAMAARAAGLPEPGSGR
jgi:AcrR family transcriptional regulator